MVGIYSFKNKINEKRYVGQSVNVESRYTTHLNLAQKEGGEVSEKILYQALRKYGLENFEFEILEECLTGDLNEREVFWIEFFDTFNSGYNATKGGTGVVGPVGEDVYCALLTNREVLEIKSLLSSSRMRQVDIAKKYGCSRHTVSSINTGSSWASVGSNNFPIRKFHVDGNSSEFSDEEVMTLRGRYVNEESQVIYQSYSHRCSLSTFRSLLNGNRYSHLPAYKKRQKIWVEGTPKKVINNV